jgi:outer membrane biosynthesis protein TonB
MTTASQSSRRMSVLMLLLPPTVSLYLPLQAQAIPSQEQQVSPIAEALLPLQSQTAFSEDALTMKRFDTAQSIAAQQVSPDQPLPTNPSSPTEPQQPTDQQPPTDSSQPTSPSQPAVQPPSTEPQQPPTDQKPEAQKKPRRINYFGIGGNIGLVNDGSTATGSGGFSILGRNSLTNNLSIHSTSVFGDKSIQSTALTGGVPIKNKATGRTILFPFVGAGLSIKTSNFTVYPLVTAGVDIPINRFLTGTVRLNTTFAERTDVGVVMGVGVDIFGLLFKRK